MRAITGMRGVIAAISALGLASCGSKGEDPGVSIGNLFAYQTTTPGPAPRASRRNIDVVCPPALVADGQSAFRVYAGSDHSNSGVKQQYSLGDLSRECLAEENNLQIRVGISGYVQAGPMGGAGTFSVPVKVMIRRETDLQPAAVRTYRIAATIAPGDTSGTYALVTEPITVPFISEQADEDYNIYVGLDQSGPATPLRAAKKSRRHR